MSDHDRLNDMLTRRAAGVGSSAPFGLSDIQDRARQIRRRRTAASGLAAAAVVLAVAVPVGLDLTREVPGREAAGPATNPTAGPTSTPTPTVFIGETLEVPLDVEKAPVEGTASVPVAVGNTLVLPSGEQVRLPSGTPERFVTLGDDWLVATRSDGDDGSAVATVSMARVSPDGGVEPLGAASYGLAVSADGTLAAYARPEGPIVTVSADGETVTLPQAASLPSVAALRGSGSCQDSGTDCLVYVNSNDGDPAVTVDSQGVVNAANGLLSVDGLAEDGRVAGIVETADDGSCSAVVLPGDRVDSGTSPTTCDHSLGAFSPDGRLVLGPPAYFDGPGYSSLALLDAATLKPIVEFARNAPADAFVADATWLSSDTVLATVFQGGTWHLVRLGLDGSIARVAVGDDSTWTNPDDAYLSPLRIPTA